MAYNSLSDFIDALEKAGELIRISGFADPDLEISEIADRFSKQPDGGKALLFENTGTGFPVLINSLGSEKRICMALGVRHLDDIAGEISSILDTVTGARKGLLNKIGLLPSLIRYAGFLPRNTRKKAPCQEVIHNKPDLDILPVLKTWPHDGGKFFTFPLVHTVDPETGIRNVGMYRMQVFDERTTGMHWHRHKTGASHFAKYKKAGKLMPVAVALGGDPILTYCATAPLPDQLDEYIFAGFLRKRPVKLVKARTQDIYVPAEADIIIEGYVDPWEEFRIEGPFGDHTGFYSLEDKYPVFHVTCITHRHDAVFPATVVGIPPMEDAWIAKATERIFLWPVKKTIAPELTEMNIPEFGVAHNLTIVSIDKSYPGQAEKVMNSLWGAGQMMFNKFMVVVGDPGLTSNYTEIIRKLSDADFRQRLSFSRGPLDVLDHSAQNPGYGGKMGIDLTGPLEGEGVSFPGALTGKQDTTQGGAFGTWYSGDLYPGTRILLISVNKEEKESAIVDMAGILKLTTQRGARIAVLIDDMLDTNDLFTVSWAVLNNTDPQRDISVIPSGNDHILFADGTSKETGKNNFIRQWPNVIVMDEKTINTIDGKWDKLFQQKLITSPSLRFRHMVRNDDAVANS
jgi:4-hydroxy-3-polyprenylbenzoate decarboxylase